MDRSRKKAARATRGLSPASEEKRRGWGSKLTLEVSAALVKAAAAGMPMRSAAHLVGIEDTTLSRWLQQGQGLHPERRPTPATEQFARDWAAARAQFLEKHVAAINRASHGWTEHKVERGQVVGRDGSLQDVDKVTDTEKFDWKAAAWMLERAVPDEFGHPSSRAKQKGQDTPFTTKVITVERAPNRRVEPEDGSSEGTVSDDRPKVLLIPHVLDPQPESDGQST